MSGDNHGRKFNKCKKSKQIESDLELELNLKTQVESSEDDLDSDKRKVLLVQNVSEKKKVEAIAKKLEKTNKKEVSNKKKVRVEQKENNIPVVMKGVPTP